VVAHRLVGTAISAGKLSNPSYAAVAAREFDYVTPENETKFAALEPTQGQFTYTTAEQIFTFAATHGMKVKGHNLLWHQAAPSWLPRLGPQAIHDAVVNHATQVVTHFKGRVVAWDVVNEVIDDTATAAQATNPITALRVGDATTYPLYHSLGSTDTERQNNLYALIKDLFAAARAADPNALLLYNDYNIEGAGPKADAAYALAVKLKGDGAPIQGVGFQNHDGLTSPATADLAANMQRLVARGFVVNISELDIAECGAAAPQANAEQATRWRAIAAVCVAEAACDGITTWGIDDADSWKTLDATFHCTTGDPLPHPLMFDDAFAPKPSYTAMLNALLGK
jgi:endo-1,4-beta-xylanase